MVWTLPAPAYFVTMSSLSLGIFYLVFPPGGNVIADLKIEFHEDSVKNSVFVNESFEKITSFFMINYEFMP
jgi:hypothetical protein